MDDNEFMLLMHSVVEAARERWPRKDDDYLFSEIQDALAAAFEEQPADG
jgi:hypothetical protein